MHRRAFLLILIGLMASIVMILGACKRAPTTPFGQRVVENTPTLTSTVPSEVISSPTTSAVTMEPYPMPTQPAIIQTQEPYPVPPDQTEEPQPSPTPYTEPSSTSTQAATQAAQESPTPIPPSPTSTASAVPAYPGPGQPTSGIPPAYPGPEISSTPPAYPGPASPTPRSTRTPQGSISPSQTGEVSPLPTATRTPEGGTPQATPTELPPQPPLSPPPAGSSVTIWHTWGPAETDVLLSIIESFRRIYPDVTFTLLYVPRDEILNKYSDDAYFGAGPNLLIGPDEWGPGLFKGTLISNLDPYTPNDYLENINPAALSAARYRGSLISLPLSINGLVMFRNAAIVPDAPANFDELMVLSRQATRGGNVGSYLERGAYFSAANILSLGGRIMDENANPGFNDAFGLEWLDLLAAYDEAGAVTFNTNRDLDMFKKGRVGIIIDGTWNISTLIQSIGQENLAIDTWPTYGTGHMSGWVQSENVFVNSNTSGDDLIAALSFIGYLLDPNVQMRLAEVGQIPSVLTTQPRDVLIQQAMAALADGEPYPNEIANDELNIYWKELDDVIQDVFKYGVKPEDALENAYTILNQILAEMRTEP